MEQSDEKLILARLLDKINLCKTKNKIVNTEFLNIFQIDIIQKKLNELKEKNYFFFGGYEDANYKVLIIYPEKLTSDIAKSNLENIIKAIKIELPKEVQGKYKHGDYLATLMKLGLERDRIGDILVSEEGSYILTLSENAEYIKNSLSEFIRFKKAKIDIININDIETIVPEFESIRIVISSLRLDNFVAALANASRSTAEELIRGEKILVNSKEQDKATKLINVGDVLVIRGKGKYIVDKTDEKSQKGRNIVELRKYK